MKFTSRVKGYAPADIDAPLFLDLDPKGGKLVPTLSACWAQTSEAPALAPADAAALAVLHEHTGAEVPETMTQIPLAQTMPELVLNPTVSRFVMGGADLMAPGVVRPAGEWMAAAASEDGASNPAWRISPHLATSLGMPDAPEGALIMLRTAGNPCPFALGTLLKSTREVVTGGMRGKMWTPVFIYRDALWEMCGRDIPNPGFQQREVAPVPLVTAAARWLVSVTSEVMHNMKAASAAAAAESEEVPEVDVAAAAAQLQAARAAAIAAANVAGVAGWEVWATVGLSWSGWHSFAQQVQDAASEEDVAAAAARLALLEVGGGGAGGSEEGGDAGAGAAGVTDAGTGVAAELGVDAAWRDWSADELVWKTFLQALRTTLRPKVLPALANAVWSGHILPARPTGSTLDIRATKWGKVAQLLADAESRGILTCSTETGEDGGVMLYVAELDRSHPEVRAHDVWADMEGPAGGAAAAAGTGAAADKADTKLARGVPTVQELVKPLFDQLPVLKAVWTDAVSMPLEAQEDAELPALPAGVNVRVMSGKVRAPKAGLMQLDADAMTGAGMPVGAGEAVSAEQLEALEEALSCFAFKRQEVVSILGRYARAHNLLPANDKTAVTVDETVAKLLFQGTSKKLIQDFLGEAPATPPRRVPKRVYAELALARMAPWYVLNWPTGDVEVHKGEAPVIMVEETKIPNRKSKTGTRITGIHAWGMDPAVFARDAQKQFATSTSVVESDDGEPNVVFIQGEVVEAVGALFAELGIPKKYIKCTVLDAKERAKAGKGKKQGAKRGGRRK